MYPLVTDKVRMKAYVSAYVRLMRHGLDLLLISAGKSDENSSEVRKLLMELKLADSFKKLTLVYSGSHERQFQPAQCSKIHELFFKVFIVLVH